jgi:hypothetical protein
MFDLKQYKNILTFFAHPDDETLAAGATIKKLTDMGGGVKFMSQFRPLEFIADEMCKKKMRVILT